MSEKEDFDYNFNEEIDKLNRTEGRKIKFEERTRKALWALEDLEREGLIDEFTSLDSLIQVVESREKELKPIAEMEEVTNIKSEDPIDREFYEVTQNQGAKDEVIKARRLLDYYESARIELGIIRKKGAIISSASGIKKDMEERLGNIEKTIEIKEAEKRNS